MAYSDTTIFAFSHPTKPEAQTCLREAKN